MNIVDTSLKIWDWFANLDKKVDVWITDPPYEFNNQNGSGRFKYKDNSDGMYDRFTWSEFERFAKEMYNSSNNGARAFIFCNRDGLVDTTKILESVGWKQRNILVWDKQVFGMGCHFRNQAEYIIYVSKGKPKKYATKMGNIFHYKPPKLGPTSKPNEIWRDILNSISVDNDVVADPFAGTNPLGKAIANNQNFSTVLDTVYINIFEQTK